MSTAAQVEANRQNAALSTGPRTEEGKTASSQNRLRHGFCGYFRVLDFESAEIYEDLLNSLRDEHQPGTATEHILIERLAQHHWLSQRAQRLQHSILNVEETGGEGSLDRGNDKEFALYLRYQTSNERAFSKCLNDLLKLRAEKRKQEIGFERQSQKAAEEQRKLEAHQAKLRQQNARAGHAELDFEIKQFVEARLPGHTDIPFTALKRVLAHSIEQFAAELDANPGLARSLKAA